MSIQHGISGENLQISNPVCNWQVTQYQRSAFLWTLLVELGAGKMEFKLLYAPNIVSSEITESALKLFSAVFLVLLHAIDGPSELPKTDFSWPQVPEWIDLTQKVDQGEAQPLVRHASLRAAFEDAAFRYADLVALESPYGSMTYEQLGKVTTSLAITLSKQTDCMSPIAILADGSVNWIISILAIVKVCFTFCAIDDKLSDERIRGMLRLSGANTILTSPTARLSNV